MPDSMDDLEELLSLQADAFMAEDSPDVQRIGRRMKERECGSCTFCCYAKGVEDVPGGKPPWQRCPSQCDSGCSIYESRPTACRSYGCAWRLGFGGDSSRPDRLGAIADCADISESVNVDIGDQQLIGLTIRAYRPYAFYPMLRIIRDASRVGIVFVAFSDRRSDVEKSILRFDSDPDRLIEALKQHSGRGVCPRDWVVRLPDGERSQEEESETQD